MKVFKLDNIKTDRRYCRVDAMLACIGQLAQGLPARPTMERLDEDVLDLEMNEHRGGLELSDFVSTLDAILPLRKACATAIIEGFDVGEHELLPARLINAKKRVHSDDYVILNPLGRFDCLNTALSDMNDDKDFPMVRLLGKWCLHADKIPTRDLFRVASVPGYIFSERLVEFIQTKGFTNFRFTPAPLC